jgi:hypothetical protein
MPIHPIDPHEIPPNPFILEQSKLLKAAAALAKPETQPVQPVLTQPGKLDPKQHFEISTRQIISLIIRFRLRSLTYDQLKSLPLSRLNQEEKDFVSYLRRNPHVFERIAKLDNDPSGISVDDVKIAARLAGDALVLSDEDIEYLKDAPVKANQRLSEEESEPMEKRRTTQKLQTQDLINTVDKLNPDGLSYEELLALNAGRTGLRGKALKSLEFLQSPAVSKVLEKVVKPYDGILTPEALRVLTSLLWNPAIYGATPIVFYRTAPLEHTHEEPIVPLHTVDRVDDNKHNIRVDRFKPSLRLEAHHILNICHKLSDDGHVSLKQIQRYQPENRDEEKALNLLRQTQIFQALAGLDDDPDSLSDDDIKLALAEGTIMLSDPYMVLVILP